MFGWLIQEYGFMKRSGVVLLVIQLHGWLIWHCKVALEVKGWTITTVNFIAANLSYE